MTSPIHQFVKRLTKSDVFGRAVEYLPEDVRGINVLAGDVHGGMVDVNILLGNVLGGEVSAKIHIGEVLGGAVKADHHTN